MEEMFKPLPIEIVLHELKKKSIILIDNTIKQYPSIIETVYHTNLQKLHLLSLELLIINILPNYKDEILNVIIYSDTSTNDLFKTLDTIYLTLSNPSNNPMITNIINFLNQNIVFTYSQSETIPYIETKNITKTITTCKKR